MKNMDGSLIVILNVIESEDVLLLSFVDSAFFFRNNFEFHRYCSEINVGRISF